MPLTAYGLPFLPWRVESDMVFGGEGCAFVEMWERYSLLGVSS